MKGSEHNDLFENVAGKVQTKSNFSGGIQGGISNGMDIYCHIAFKPVATISQTQETIDLKERRPRYKAKADTILVYCRVQCLLWKPWPLLS
jgi:chorismate synthase